jgi:hypothetical protein
MCDIKWISPQEHDGIFGFINVLTDGKKHSTRARKTAMLGEEGGTLECERLDTRRSGRADQLRSGLCEFRFISLESGGI